jgi:hypothetical protein
MKIGKIKGKEKKKKTPKTLIAQCGASNDALHTRHFSSC